MPITFFAQPTAKSFGTLAFAAQVTLATLAMASAGSASAQTTAVNVAQPWVRATVAQQKATGAFMQLQASQNARLLSVQSAVAGVAEVHEMAMDGAIMKMRRIEGIDLPAGKAVALTPGGYHIMLMELKQPLAVGETVSMTLTFEDRASGKRYTQEVQAPVQPITTGASPATGHAGHQH